MDIRTIAARPEPGDPELIALLQTHNSLGKALSDWATTRPESTIAAPLPRVVVQDEYCHDVVVRWGNTRFIVYATT